MENMGMLSRSFLQATRENVPGEAALLHQLLFPHSPVLA